MISSILLQAGAIIKDAFPGFNSMPFLVKAVAVLISILGLFWLVTVIIEVIKGFKRRADYAERYIPSIGDTLILLDGLDLFYDDTTYGQRCGIYDGDGLVFRTFSQRDPASGIVVKSFFQYVVIPERGYTHNIVLTEKVVF